MAPIEYESATAAQGKPRTLYDKIWDDHIVHQGDGTTLIYIDRHLVHEVTSPQAFEGLRMSSRKVRRPDCTLATVDHNIPTDDRKALKDTKSFISELEARTQVMTLEENVEAFGLKFFGMDDSRQGIVHVIGPEQGFTLPGTTVVCGDSHTSTHGAFGALAFGIGTSEVEHVLATQTLLQARQKNMRIKVDGKLTDGVGSKDVILHIIGVIGTAGGTGHVIEFCGSVIEGLSMEARMSICNMTIEAGARAGMIAPDDTTLAYLKGRPLSPKGTAWEKAAAYWKSLRSDDGAVFDKDVHIDARDIAPTVTWGTSPEDVAPITGVVPDPAKVEDPARKAAMERKLSYMGLQPGTKLEDLAVDKVFIGSCTNSRIEDLRSVAGIAKGRKVAEGVYAMIVPGSGLVKKQAEAEGLDTVFKDAGFDWREPGCSMCLGMNPDRLKPQERCAATSNRNFEGRQGPQGRTHLMSPAMAAAAALTGKLKDVRALTGGKKPEKASKGKLRDPKEFCTQPLTLPRPAAPVEDQAEEKEAAAGAAAAPATGGMPKFNKLESVIAAPLPMANVDTDCIIPKQFLKTIKRTGLGKSAFFELRYEDDGETERPGFVLNKEPYRTAQVLVALENFGCGSSREHAPWAINDFGIRCLIAPSFADIFFNNCFQNGMLPIVLTKDKVEALMGDAEACKRLTVDLPAQQIVREGGESIPFDVDPFRKDCLLNGLDTIGLTLKKSVHIESYEGSRADRFPWLEARADQAELRVCNSRASNFYARMAKGLFEGLPATQDRPARPPVSRVAVSASGAAIERAVLAVREAEASGVCTISRIVTDFVPVPETRGEGRGGRNAPNVPQVLITLEARPRAQAVAPVAAKEEGQCEAHKGGGADW